MVWVTEKQLKGDALMQGIVCEKARAIYDDLLRQTTCTSRTSEDSFDASRGWFDNFNKRTGIHSIVRHSKAARSYLQALDEYHKMFSELIAAEEYILCKSLIVTRQGFSGRRCQIGYK